MDHQINRQRTEPAFIEPMQCKPVTALPTDEKWTFEIKFDGYRCIAVKRGREVTLFSRHEKVLNRRFPGVVDALSSLDGDFVLDGETGRVGFAGRPSFLAATKARGFVSARAASPRFPLRRCGKEIFGRPVPFTIQRPRDLTPAATWCAIVFLAT